ncbi:MAG: cation diffusion facilitator family transporter [Verrucomicrobiales bacterium]
MATQRLESSLRITFIGMVVNALLTGGKMAAGILGHSQALIADAVESLADLVSSLVVWRGVVVASTPADEEHPYGHGKAEPLAAAVVAVMLFFASIWITIEAIREILRPHHTPAPFTLIVLILVVIIKESMFRFGRRVGKELESLVVHGDAFHHRSDAITSLLAGIGISIALWGGPGYEAADDYAAIVAAMIIAWNGWSLLKPAMEELMDTSPETGMIGQIKGIASAQVHVEGVEKCIVRKMGYDLFVDMHIEVAPEMSVLQAHDVAHKVKDAVMAAMPRVRDVLVHVEPFGL